jgi:hypothetical protein
MRLRHLLPTVAPMAAVLVALILFAYGLGL